MSISLLRRLVALVCVLSIVGMIVGSVKDNAGAAMTAGIFGAMAILCLIVGNAIDVGSNGGGAQEALAAELDARVQELVAAGAEEAPARAVVRKAVRFGQGDRSPG